MAATCLVLAIQMADASAETAGRQDGLGDKASGPPMFRVESTAGAHQVSVNSKFTFGHFTSTCDQVHGQFQVDPKHLETCRGEFSMPVTGIHTGIDRRDKHLRGPDWLDAGRYPDIVMTFTRAEDIRKGPAGTTTLTLVGTCSMHGVTREVRVPVTLAWDVETSASGAQGQTGVSVRAEFDVRVSDYKVKGARPFGLKVDDTHHVTVAVRGVIE